jgi:hypothetical protein
MRLLPMLVQRTPLQRMPHHWKPWRQKRQQRMLGRLKLVQQKLVLKMPVQRKQ